MSFPGMFDIAASGGVVTVTVNWTARISMLIPALGFALAAAVFTRLWRRSVRMSADSESQAR